MADEVLEIREENRVASDTLRGFFTQVVWTAIDWLDLNDAEDLVCEGNQDVDKILRDETGKIVAVTEKQIRDLEQRISVRDAAETLMGFARGFRAHTLNKRRPIFEFATTAQRARQQKNNGLVVDVLEQWPNNEQQAPTAAFVQSLRRLFTDQAATGDDRAALAFLEGPPPRWHAFASSVRWQLGKKGASDALKELAARVEKDQRFAKLPAKLVAQTLVAEVLERSAKPNQADRVLTRAALAALAGATDAEFKAHVERVASERIATLAATVDDLTARLEAETSPEARRTRALEDGRERLRRRSREAVALHRESHDFKHLGTIRIPRSATGSIEAASAASSLVLVIGDAGAGKTSALVTVAEGVLQDPSATLVWIDAGAIVGSTREALGGHLGLAQPIEDVLSSFDSLSRRVLVVDGMDAQRNSMTRNMLLKLASDVATSGWRVILTMREHDARVDQRIIDSGATEARVDHFSTDELNAVGQTHPDLGRLLASAKPKLKELLRLPFHVRLVAELLDKSVAIADFQNIEDELQLMELYWKRRITDDASVKHTREETIQAVIERIVETKSLVVDVLRLRTRAQLEDLLSLRLFLHPRGTDALDQRRLLFAHDLLFDFAVYELALRPRSADELVKWLVDLEFFGVGLAPALGYALLEARRGGAARYAELLERIEASQAPDALKQLAAKSVLDVGSAGDLSVLITHGRDPSTGEHARRMLNRIVSVLVGVVDGQKRSLLDLHPGPWADFVEEMSRELE